MKKIEVFRMPSLHREPLVINGFVFGSGEKNTVIVGPTRGNEVQQLYICSRLVKKLKEIEEAGRFLPGKMVEVIPVLNPSSINIGKRFWAMDGTDINRMFPGYSEGETTQRIAAGIFQHLQGWKVGIQLGSYYLRGDFVTHVRMMDTPYQDASTGDAFGLPFVLKRVPSPIDTTTLNYNWQIWNTRAFSMLTQSTGHIDEQSADECIDAILRYLVAEKAIKYDIHPGYQSLHIAEPDLAAIRAPRAGIFRPLVNPADFVAKDSLVGLIIDPLTGETLREIRSGRIEGTVFFAYREPLVMENQLLYRIVRKLSGV